MELKGKKLLILGGSRISCEIIRHARAVGVITAVTDYYPLEKSIGWWSLLKNRNSMVS